MNNLILHLNQLEKEEQTKPKVSRRKDISAEINEIGTKKTTEKKSMKLKAGSSRR